MRLLKISVLLLFVLSVFGCHGEPKARFKGRHQAFTNILTKAEAALYKSRSYLKAGELLSQRMKSNKSLQRKFKAIKKNESIEFFSVEKVFVFFGDTMRRQIAFYDFIEYLSTDEEVMFQKMQYKDLVYSLKQKNMQVKSKKRYDDILEFANLQGISDLVVVKFLRDTNTVYKHQYSYDKLAK